MTVYSQLPEAPQADVGGALQAADGSAQRREPSDVPSSSVSSHDAVAARQDLALPSCNRRMRFRGAVGCKLVLGVIASAAAVAMLISLCAAAFHRTAPLQLPTRRLSEGGPSKSVRGPGACGETSGDGSGDGSQASVEEEDLELPPAKKAKVEDEGADEEAEAAFIFQTSASDQGVSPSAASGTTATVLEAHSPSEPLISSKEMMAAEALLALWGEEPFDPLEQPAPGPAFQEQAEASPASEEQASPPPVPEEQAAGASPLPQASTPPLLAAASAITTAVQTTIRPISPGPAGEEVPQPQSAPVQRAAHPLVGPFNAPPFEEVPARLSDSRLTLLASSGQLGLIDPLDEWEPPSSGDGDGQPFLEHAFSRLPQVEGGDPSAFSSFVDPLRAISVKATPNVQAPLLQTMGNLLSQAVLSRSQLQQLGIITQHLIGHLFLNEGRQLQGCAAFAVETLGLRFILLDMTVSGLQLLGVSPSGPWWEQMVSRIPDTYVPPPKRRNQRLHTFNLRLLSQLTEAVRVLKTGHRPPAAVLTQIKRCLFCCLHSPIRFLKPSWDPWRAADRLFHEQFEDRSGQGDSPEPGPSHQSGS
ncbi:hypothetical protein Emed_004904 [Eimeria media]